MNAPGVFFGGQDLQEYFSESQQKLPKGSDDLENDVHTVAVFSFLGAFFQ